MPEDTSGLGGGGPINPFQRQRLLATEEEANRAIDDARFNEYRDRIIERQRQRIAHGNPKYGIPSPPFAFEREAFRGEHPALGVIGQIEGGGYLGRTPLTGFQREFEQGRRHRRGDPWLPPPGATGPVMVGPGPEYWEGPGSAARAGSTEPWLPPEAELNNQIRRRLR